MNKTNDALPVRVNDDADGLKQHGILGIGVLDLEEDDENLLATKMGMRENGEKREREKM